MAVGCAGSGPSVVSPQDTRGGECGSTLPPITPGSSVGSDGVLVMEGKTSFVKSSCYPSYDQEIQRAVEKWRYAPFMVDGVVTPVCSHVALVFKLD